MEEDRFTIRSAFSGYVMSYKGERILVHFEPMKEWLCSWCAKKEKGEGQ